MTREELDRLLDGADLVAASAIREMLAEPGVELHGDSEDAEASTANLLAIYRQRARHAGDGGALTVGLDETVERFENTEYVTLRLAAARVSSDRWAVVFLAPDQNEVVAAVAALEASSQQ